MQSHQFCNLGYGLFRSDVSVFPHHLPVPTKDAVRTVSLNRGREVSLSISLHHLPVPKMGAVRTLSLNRVSFPGRPLIKLCCACSHVHMKVNHGSRHIFSREVKLGSVKVSKFQVSNLFESFKVSKFQSFKSFKVSNRQHNYLKTSTSRRE